MKIRSVSIVAAGLLCATGFGRAQDSGNAGTSTGLPEAVHENGVSYMCGGIGAGEADRMRESAPQHDLMVTFATGDGQFLADVNVAIVDARGRRVLNTSCDGPIMLVDFPARGRYRVTAEIAGHATSATVELRHPAGGKRLPLVWPTGQVQPG